MQTEPQLSLTAQPAVNEATAPLLSLPSSESGNQLPILVSEPGNQLAIADAQPTLIQANPLPAALARHKARRKGRVACLPKPERDVVNRMLSNGVSYKNIVEALDELGFTLTERNISNWATGGYLEWRAEQDLILQNRLDQDHLLDHLRREDACELPEVGLQAAATRLSQILLQKTARADDLEANLGSLSQMVDILCRLNREIVVLQKNRDDSRRSLGRAHDPARIKQADESAAIDIERSFSNPPADCTLAKPAEPPLLPRIPTSTSLAQSDSEQADFRREIHQRNIMATLGRINQMNTNDSTAPNSPPLPAALRQLCQ